MNDLKEQLQEALKSALESGVSQNKLADQIGVSAATLINVKKGEWDNISDAMVMKLRGYFRINDWKVYETTNMKAITDLCNDAANNKKFMAVAGYTGAGKTTALRRYAAKNADAWYVLGTTIMTQKTFLTAILRSMGISEGQTVADKMGIIIKEMNSGTKSLLIIDDAGKLSDNIMRLIQIIYDETEDNAGIILAGTDYLESYINKGAILDRRGFKELQRRISFWQPCFKPTKSEISFFCSEYGISDNKAIH